jgi:glyoxylase-like metal-dependent hydrolase (beta-lactamase superfamily II)
VAEVRWTKNVGPAEITKISVGRMDNNVYIIAVGDEVGVVDAGSDDVKGVLEAVGDRKLTKVLQTHDHGDHIATLKEIVGKTNAPVYAHEKSDLPVKAESIDDGDTIDIGGVTLKVLYTPGHTPGGVSFLLQHSGESHLFAGDTLFPGGPGATWNNAENFTTIMRSLDEKLFTLPDSTHVYPGHGQDTTIGTERPSVEEWRSRGH